MCSVPWGSTVPACLDYTPRSLENLCVAVRRVCDDFLRRRRCKRTKILTASCNPIINPRIHHCGDDREGPVTHFVFTNICC